MSKQSPEYKTAVKMIKDAKSKAQLVKIEIALGRMWDAGFFTHSEFSKLDNLLIDKMDNVA